MIDRYLHAIRRFFGSTAFPVYILTLTAFCELFLLIVMLTPESWGSWGRFSNEFKVWCFSYDPNSGHLEWISVWIMFVEPLFIAGIVLVLWKTSLKPLLTMRGWMQHLRSVGGAIATLVVLMGGLIIYGLQEERPDELPPFPGERIRTRLTPHAFTLTDHRGNACTLADLQGRAVLITGIYALCSQSCPEILLQIRSVLDSMPPEITEKLHILALSLNPEYDTPQLMDSIAQAYNFGYPEFRYLNGEPDEVREILARLQFVAFLNPETGFIDHNNLFILIDSKGRIAWRFNLDPRHKPWLQAAITTLVEESSLTPSTLASRQ
jgi:protein SCO1